MVELLGAAEPQDGRHALGPFRLAYLEALITTADGRASAILDAQEEAAHGTGA
jgi:hypothetical protein